MNFLYPTFLWAAALIAVPVIIHLFNFQRAKKVYFTNIEFLRQVKSVSNARNKLKNLLVLLTRCAFIIFLTLAFAQPFLPQQKASNAGSSRYVSLYVDNSFSMQNETDNKRLFDLAVNYAEQSLRAFPNNSVFQLLTNSFDGNQNFFFEAPKISENLQKIEASNSGRQFKNIYERQLSALRSNGSESNNHIFWISDFQKYSSGDLAQLALDSSNNFYLMPLRSEQNSNLYIDSVWLENPFVKINENNTVNVKINHYGNEGVSDRIVKLFIGNNQVSSGTVQLEAGGTQTLKLNFAVNEAGAKHCRIEIDDSPVIFDNRYFFTIKVAPVIKIMHITAENSGYIPNVYGNEPFFEVSSSSVNSVDYTKLAASHLVVLQSLREVDNALQSALRNFISKGGSLAIIPAADSEPASFTSLLGFPLARISAGESLNLNPPDEQNPFFAGVFEKISANMTMPSAKPVIEWGGAGQPLLQLRNGRPFLSLLGGQGSGKIYLFASPLDNAYSDFAKNALFVPVMYKIALSSMRQSERLAYSFRESVAAIDIEEASKNDIFKLVPASALSGDSSETKAFELIPAQRVSDSRLIIDIPQTGMPAGNYFVVRRGDNKVMALVAFNYDKNESVFDCWSAEELRSIFGKYKNVQIFDEVDPERFVSEFKARHVARPLWRYMLLAALAFLLTEILLLRFWRSA